MIIDLLQHIRIKHENVRYPCDQCSHMATTLGRLSSVIIHFKGIEIDEKLGCGDAPFLIVPCLDFLKSPQKSHV